MSTLSGAPRLSDCCYQPSYCQPNYCPPKKCGGTLVTANVVRWKFDEKCCRVAFEKCEPICIFVYCEQEQNVASAIMAQYIRKNGPTEGFEKLLKYAENGLLQVIITDRTSVTPPCAPPAECTQPVGTSTASAPPQGGRANK